MSRKLKYLVTWIDTACDYDQQSWTVLGLCKSQDEFMQLNPIGGHMGYRLHKVDSPDNQVPVLEILNYGALEMGEGDFNAVFERMKARWQHRVAKEANAWGAIGRLFNYRWPCQGDGCETKLRVPPGVARICRTCSFEESKR